MKINKYLWLLVGLILLAGCGFDNTMYNARKSFQAGQSKPLNANGKPNKPAMDDYDKTIKKCGIILTERKNSPEADDALFLLAKALYFRGNNQFQAKDQFESLRRNFPGSPFIPEAVVFIAQIDRQINLPKEAENILEEFIRQPENRKYHARALFVLADFAIQDKDYIKAQYWLDKILTTYPGTKEFKEAFFLSGKLWFEQGDYAKSLEQFQKLERARRIDKVIVLDARYYIAWNQLLLGESKQAFSTIRKLISEEYRPERLPLCNVLKGRILLALGKEEEGRELLSSIIKTATRSLASAEAYYWLGEYDFLKKQDVPAAVENYSKAKSESTLSPYTSPATERYNATNLIKQTALLKPAANLQLYLDNNLVIAENYFSLFNLPDSVFSTFRQIDDTPSLLKVYEDSLTVKIDSLTLAIDSLAMIVDTTDVTAVNDSTGITGKAETPEPDDNISVKTDSFEGADNIAVTDDGEPEEKPDELPSVTDMEDSAAKEDIPNLEDMAKSGEAGTLLPNPDVSDSLRIDHDKAMADSLAAVKTRNLQAFRDKQAARKDLETSRQELQEASQTFVETQIPYSLFVKASMVKRGLADSTMLTTIYQDMQQRFPENKYTNALRMLLAGEPVRLVDPALDREESSYDQALGDLPVVPDSAVVVLESLTDSGHQSLKLKANFRLGWFYTFESVDTTKAKPYLDQVLKLNRTSDYGALVTRFYNGTQYNFPRVSFAIVDSLMKKFAEQDSTTAASIADSLAIKAAADSTFEQPDETEQTDEINDPDMEIKPEEYIDTTPIIKPEETPLAEPEE